MLNACIEAIDLFGLVQSVHQSTLEMKKRI